MANGPYQPEKNEWKPYCPSWFFIRDDHYLGEEEHIGWDKIHFDLRKTLREELITFYNRVKADDEKNAKEYRRVTDYHLDLKATLILYYERQKDDIELAFWKEVKTLLA